MSSHAPMLVAVRATCMADSVCCGGTKGAFDVGHFGWPELPSCSFLCLIAFHCSLARLFGCKKHSLSCIPRNALKVRFSGATLWPVLTRAPSKDTATSPLTHRPLHHTTFVRSSSARRRAPVWPPLPSSSPTRRAPARPSMRSTAAEEQYCGNTAWRRARRRAEQDRGGGAQSRGRGGAEQDRSDNARSRGHAGRSRTVAMARRAGAAAAQSRGFDGARR
jgi:hypothetical protein